MDFRHCRCRPSLAALLQTYAETITGLPDTPQSFMEWRLKDQQTYETLNTTGTLKRMQEELDLIKEKYSMSRSMDMPEEAIHHVPRNIDTLEKIRAKRTERL